MKRDILVTGTDLRKLKRLVNGMQLINISFSIFQRLLFLLVIDKFDKDITFVLRLLWLAFIIKNGRLGFSTRNKIKCRYFKIFGIYFIIRW